MKIYILRHGQTALNASGFINGRVDEALTSLGEQQAHEAGKLLPDTLKRIYASPLKRARQTAEIVNAAKQLPIFYDENLQEVDFGSLNGTPYLEEYRLQHEAMRYDWRPSGENVEDVMARVLDALRAIAEENQDGEALIVAHGGIVRMLHYLQEGTTLGVVDNASLHTFNLAKILATRPQ